MSMKPSPFPVQWGSVCLLLYACWEDQMALHSCTATAQFPGAAVQWMRGKSSQPDRTRLQTHSQTSPRWPQGACLQGELLLGSFTDYSPTCLCSGFSPPWYQTRGAQQRSRVAGRPLSPAWYHPLLWEKVLEHICETEDLMGTGLHSSRYHFTLVFLGWVFFRDFSSGAKSGISVPYSSSKNCAFPALRPNWKIETVGKCLHKLLRKFSNLLVSLEYAGSFSHL